MKAKSILISVAGCFALAGPALAAGDRAAGETGQMGTQQAAMAGQHDQDTVRQVQQALNQKGHSLQVDGIMGPDTESALRNFQQQQGLDATGQIDQQTLAALNVEGAAPTVGGEASPAPAGAQPTTPQPPAETGTTGGTDTTGTTGAPADQGAGTQTGDRPSTGTTPGGTTN